MNKKYKIFFILPCLLFFSPHAAFSEADQSVKKSSQPNLADAVAGMQNAIYSQLLFETDPEKRKALIFKLREVQALEYEPSVRDAYLKKANPNFPTGKPKATNSSKTEQAYTPKLPPLNINISDKAWDAYSFEEKNKFCTQLNDTCIKDKKLDLCRFVIAKCKSFLRKDVYQDLIQRFSTKK